MADKNKGNPVSDQSKRWMENALLKLMQTDNYHEITIQEIAYQAGLSRRTFYRNYTSKDEILEGYFYRIWEEYRALIIQETDFSLANIARVFFTKMQEYKDFLTLANRQQLLPFFLTRVDELLPIAFYEARGDTLPFSRETIQYILAFSAGGFMRILILWLKDGAKKSPEEMAAIVEDFNTMVK